MALDRTVAKQIKKARQLRGLSQTAAGAALGVSQRTWADYERGVIGVGLDDLERIAKVLGFPINYFILAEDEQAAANVEIETLLQQLNDSDREDILNFIRVKIQRNPLAAKPSKKPLKRK